MVEGGKRARHEVLRCPACEESLKAYTGEELKVMPDDEKPVAE